MRKITSILSMFLLIAGWNTASAQFAFKKFASFGDDITDVIQLVDGGYYVLQNFEGNKCIKIKTDGSMVLGLDNNLSADDASDGLAVFKLHIDNSGSTPLYSFESASTGNYIPTIKMGHHKEGGVVVSTTKGKFELRTQATVASESDTPETKEGYFIIKNSTDDYYLDIASEANMLTGWLGRDDRAWFKIRKANLNEDASALQVFYKVVTKKEEVVVSTAYGIATTGDAYSSYTEPANKSYYLTTLEEPENKVIARDNMTLVYKYSGTAPFEVGQWYSLKIKQSNQVLRAIAEENNLYVNTDKGSTLEAIANTYPNFLNALWRIEESGLGVKIYNKAVGKYLKGNGVGNTKELRATFDNTGTVFYVKSINGGLGFYTGSGYLNACCPSSSTGANTRLGLWNAAGDGSTFYCEKKKEELLALGKTAFASTPDVYSYTSNNALIKGGNYSGNKESAEEATTLDGLFEIGDKTFNEVNPEAGAYYLIRNVNQGAIGTGEDKNKYLSSEYVFCDTEGKIQTQVGTVTNDRNIKRTKGTSALLPRLWKFEQTSDGEYYLLNVNTNRYVALGSNLDVPTEQYQGSKTPFSLQATNKAFGYGFNASNDQTTMFMMGAKNTFVNAQSGMGQDSNGKEYDGVATWTDQKDGGNYWQFIKVTEVPLTIAANDYTTLCLPFNVKLPENSTVKAYYASQAAGDVLKLTEITGIIPANEGVILHNTSEAEAANINLTITTEEGTSIENKLEGVTAKRAGYSAGTNYVLAEKNGKVGFYKASFTTIVANKAYLPQTNVQNAQGVMMAFSFGDEVTGIDNVNAATATAKKYYDLQGRRVLYPAKGIFVTEDGQKVLLK